MTNSKDVRWLLQPMLFDLTAGADGPEDKLSQMVSAVEGAGMRWAEYTMADYMGDAFGHFPAEDAVVFMGSLNAARKVRQRGPWWPGAWCNLDALRCSAYYPHLGSRLVNGYYYMAPFGDLERVWPWAIDMMRTDDLFVRPDAGDKGFTGHVVTRAGQADFFGVDRPYLADRNRPGDICVIAPAQNLLAEARTFVVDGAVVAWSLYRKDRRMLWSRDVPEGALSLARDVAGELHARGLDPDPAYTLDVALVDLGSGRSVWRVMELNSFSCSGVYDADLCPLVEAAAELAARIVSDGTSL